MSSYLAQVPRALTTFRGIDIRVHASFAILDAFMNAGFNAIDTADVYSGWVPGHTGGEIRQQKRRCIAYIIDADIAPQGGIFLYKFQYLAETTNTRSSQGLDRTRRDAIDAYALGTEVLSEITHVGLKAGLGEPHHIVVRYRALSAKVGQRQHGGVTSCHHGQRAPRERSEAVGADIVRDAKGLSREAIEQATL